MIRYEYIEDLLEIAKKADKNDINEILEKARKHEGLSHKEVAILIQNTDPKVEKEIFKIAGQIKKDIYGDRIVIFAPLYLSNYCVNNCKYCGYKLHNDMPRRRLNNEEIREEVMILEKMGHKRIALEAGEDPKNCDIDYVLESMNTIYDTYNDNGNIRRINVNIAATTVENYRKLKDAGIGTYILFQETYHKKTYEEMHISGPKSDYNYHLMAFDRAMEAGIDDVGGGALFGLYDYKYEILGLMLHNEYLENKHGVGFHTISVPRIKKAAGMNLEEFPHILTDDEFKRIVALIRIAVPFTGIILSTRESKEMREEVIEYGVSQISAGSSTGVGGYKEREEGGATSQFEVADNRKPSDIIKELIKEGHIPSYCTACYRMNRTGDRFMELAKSGEIQNVCEPNALLTLTEYALDYGDDELKNLVDGITDETLDKIRNENTRRITEEKLEQIKSGKRDLFL